MKKLLSTVGICLALAACSKVTVLDPANGSDNKLINFSVSTENMVKATNLQNAAHYNFGVFAYKSSEARNNIMENYLVGYMDQANKKGYYFSGLATQGDAAGNLNGQSMWQYEKLGKLEYSYTGAEGYYTKDQTEYMSNEEYQYLRYWDLSAATTSFYAYAPYINGASTATYDNESKKLVIPAAKIHAGYDDPTANEFMYAAKTVAKADYGKDVSLNFRRLNAKVNIKFWEDIDGYSVRILDLSSSFKGVSAAPAIRLGDAAPYTYNKGQYFANSGETTIDFSAEPAVVSQPGGTTTQDALQFKAPQDAEIGYTRLLASKSPTTYYAIPMPAGNTTGFTFHVSYELTSTTGEKITVSDATVFVPSNFTTWAPNTHYTYVFKITRGSNGTTDVPGTIDPNDPSVPEEPALYPIVFDNCTIEDYSTIESDHNITDGTQTIDYNVSISPSSVNVANIAAGASVEVTPSLYNGSTPVADPAGAWSVGYPEGLSDADKALVAYDAASKKYLVKAGAKNGIYTVIYTPDASEGGAATTYTATLTLFGNDSVVLSTSEVGTAGQDATTFTVTVTPGSGADVTSEQLSIVYPDGLTSDQKAKVHFVSLTQIKVEKEAVVGTYRVAFTSAAGTTYADFAVKNYGLYLDNNLISHNNTDQVITLSTIGATFGTDAVLSLGGTYAGITLNADNTITVAKTAAEGTYEVVNTVTKNGAVTVYKKSFTVQNSYVLSIDKTILDKDDDDAARTITVTASKNAIAESTLANIELIDPNGDTITLPATGMTFVVPADGVIGTYTVNFKDGANIKKTVAFILTL